MNKTPLTFALFEKRIEGDDCLMELARRRFQQAGMGAEMHAANPEQLDWLLRYRPGAETPVVVHLPRGFDLADSDSRGQVENFSRRFAGRIYGLVMHDHRRLADDAQGYVQAAREMNSRLCQISNCPWLFIEYAAGLELETFVEFFEAIRELDRVSVCVDIGHIGIFQTRKAYAEMHPGVDACAIKSQPDTILQTMPDLEEAVATALPSVLDLVEQLGVLGKPAHFHLHDGHPLSTFSPFGVSDHLSFLAAIPLGFDYRGRRQAALMFGPDGLAKIVAGAIRAFGPGRVSFSLEIHPQENRLPLGDADDLFYHWRDKTNAEKMNGWLAMLAENHRLLREAIAGGAA